MATSLLERLRSKYIIDPVSGCWVWTAARDNLGYGRIQRGTRGQGTALAHKVSYEISCGPVPDGLELDHKCRTPCCVNPSHLEPVTHQENVLRGTSRAASKAYFASISHCPQGHEYSETNTYIAITAKGYRSRMCRECMRQRSRARRAANA